MEGESESLRRLLFFYSGCGAGVSLALLSVILFSSSSSDTRSREVPSTWIGRLPERLEEKLMGPPRLEEEEEQWEEGTEELMVSY